MTYREIWSEFVKEFSGWNAKQEKLDNLILCVESITIDKFEINGIEIKIGGNDNEK